MSILAVVLLAFLVGGLLKHRNVGLAILAAVVFGVLVANTWFGALVHNLVQLR